MSKLENILKKEGLCAVDNYLAICDIKKLLNDKSFSFYQFFTDYLNHDFVYNNKYPFLAIKILVENGYESLEEKFINCRYINTIPKTYLTDVLIILNKNYPYGCYKLLNYIINLFDIGSMYDLIGYCVKNNICFKKEINIALANQLISLKNIDLILFASNLNNNDINRIINKEITSNFSYPDLVKYFTYYQNDYEDDTISALLNTSKKTKVDKTQVLGDTIKIISTKLDTLKDVKFNKYGRLNSIINEFIYDINNVIKTNELDEFDLNYLAHEIAKTNNLFLIENWVLNTSCSYNYTLVDKLISQNNQYIISLIFDAQDKSYINYLVEKIFQDKYLSLLNYLLNNFNKDEKGDLVIATKFGDIRNLDYLLKTMYDANPKFKIEDKNIIYALVTNGSSYTTKLLQEVEFTKEERIKILKSWKEKKLYDFYLVYGSYILNGLDGLNINESTITENREMLLSLRKN